MPADHPPVHFRISHLLQSAGLLVTDAEWVDERQSSWLSRVTKAFTERT